MPKLRDAKPVSTIVVPKSAKGLTRQTIKAQVASEVATAKMLRTSDSFQNFAAKVGIGTDNQSSGSTYGFNPITRNRNLLEWMYRGSWVVGKVVDCVADDMTRAGVEITGDTKPEDIDRFHQAMNRLGIWSAINETTKWGRLYGGALAVMMIDGQKPETPLNPKTVGKDSFKGLLVLDRWMVQPNFGVLVTEYGPDLGKPTFYETVVEGFAIPKMKIHYSRVLRIDGVDLPFWQKIAENLWGMSVIERLFDRLVAFDSTTQGAAQLVYKAHLRTLSVENLRQIVAAGGPAMNGLLAQVELMRRLQSNEGITIIDAKDKFEAHQYAFSGLNDVLMQFGQQLSGASDIPLVRLFGQSPAGLNSTGDSDIRNYYDGIKQQQEHRYRRPFAALIEVMFRSEGINYGAGLGFNFNPLWQMSDKEKSEIADRVSTAVDRVTEGGIIGRKTALKELRQSSRVTGVFSNITDEEIEAADDDPPPPTDGDEPPGPDDEQDDDAEADDADSDVSGDDADEETRSDDD